MKKEKPSILLIGYDEHLCLSLLYCLRNEKLNIHLLTHNKKSVCKYSRFLDEIFYYDSYDQLPEAIAKVAAKIKLDLIMPYDELESLYVSKYAKELEKIAPVVPLTEPEIYEKAINKNDLNAYLVAKGLEAMPKSITLSKSSTIKDLKGLTFPILIKPSRGSFGRGIVSLSTQPELESYFDSIREAGQDLTGFAAQEFVVGSDITCNIFAIDGKIEDYTVQESPVKGLNNYAKNDDLTFRDDESVYQLVAQVAEALNWNGVACFDLRRDAASGKIYLLEINGRFWGSVSSSLDRANVNFPLIMITHSLLNQKPKYVKKEAIQISAHQLIKELKSLHLGKIKDVKYRSYLYDPLARFMKYMPR